MKTRIYRTGRRSDHDNVTALDALELAFYRELPAFWVSRIETSPDGELLLEVASGDSTPDWAFNRLPGFGVGDVTLAEVA